MFFALSKILGFFAIPSNLVVSIGILGLLTDQLFKLLRRWLLPWSARF